MALPRLTPEREPSAIILPEMTEPLDVTEAVLPFGTYVDLSYWSVDETEEFKKGAADMVTFVYRKLGGDVLDIELVPNQVYAAYEEACLEYSYMINVHHGKNILGNILGSKTGSFDSEGQITGSNGVIDSTFHLGLKYPKFDFAYARRVSEGISEEANIGGSLPVYSASFDITPGIQDYNLQRVVASMSAFNDSTSSEYVAPLDNKKVVIRKIYYKTPRAGWSFYGYYGGINVVGNLANYGQYADSSTFEVVPVWQHKLQARAYENHIFTRASHFSYELKNNKIRINPIPGTLSPTKFWFEFVIPEDPWTNTAGLVQGTTDADGIQTTPPENNEVDIGIDGVNNINTAPFQNLPYVKINAIGKQWIRRFTLALCKEMLGYVRSKFGPIPIPGNEITLNGNELISAAREEQTGLRDELKDTLDEFTYKQLMEDDAALAASAEDIMSQVPLVIYTG